MWNDWDEEEPKPTKEDYRNAAIVWFGITIWTVIVILIKH